MIKSPKCKSFQMASLKDRKGYMKNLQQQLNKSRMAVQTITTFKNNQMNYKKKIDQIQEQLHSCLSRINQQTKKNVALSELISLLKGQMFQFQKKQKQEEQLSVSESEKRIKKIQYDIQQILQKHNEEIAKINLLKQQANCCRSQRVVFSNLFKKLQKQLKQNQQLYKQNLMKSEVAKDKVLIPASFKFSTNTFQEEDQQYIRQSLTKKTLFLIQNQMESDAQDPFITLNRNPSQTAADLKFKMQRKKRNTEKQDEQDNLDVKITSKGFNEMISCYQTFLQQLKVHIGYSESQQIIDHYKKLELKNQNLASHVQLFNDQLIKYQHLISQIQRQKRSSQFYQYSKDFPLGSMRRIRGVTSRLSQQNTSNTEQILSILSDLNQALNINQNQYCEINEEQLKELDYKLDQIIQECQTKSGQNQAIRQHTIFSQTNVDLLLQRMQKFGQCQKLLDLDSLKQEYTKQVGKCKKSKIKK